MKKREGKWETMKEVHSKMRDNERKWGKLKEMKEQKERGRRKSERE